MGVLIIAFLLVLPVLAVHRRGAGLGPEIILYAHWVGMSAFTYWMYADDKRRAVTGEWRVPELRFHLLGLFGGWPGGLLAQRRFRHKCSKIRFQIVFWATVGAWQLLAVDSLLGCGIGNTGAEWLLRLVMWE